MLALLLALAAHDASSIQWIENDPPAAISKAAAENKPVFVDLWATWCHSCLSMKRYVLNDAGMRPAANAAVFLAVETELPKNRSFVTKYPVDGLPTFILLDPKSGKVISRWLGSGTVNDMRDFVVHGRELLVASGGGKVPAGLKAAQAGDERQIAQDAAGAMRDYEAALKAASRDDWYRPQIVGKLLTAYARVGTPEALRACVKLGTPEMAVPNFVDAAAGVANCAEGLKDDAAAKAALQKAIGVLVAAANDPKAPLSADDRSDSLGTAAGLLDDASRHPEAVKAQEQRRDLLLAAQKSAPDAETASTFDAHLAEAYIYLKQADKAEAMLGAREKEMPDDYNPPARLARALLEQSKAQAAEQAIDRALKLAPQGPRKVGLLGLKEKILTSLGKPVESVLREQLALIEAMPQTARWEKQKAAIKARLDNKG